LYIIYIIVVSIMLITSRFLKRKNWKVIIHSYIEDNWIRYIKNNPDFGQVQAT
jgi:hypothetical protein